MASASLAISRQGQGRGRSFHTQVLADNHLHVRVQLRTNQKNNNKKNIATSASRGRDILYFNVTGFPFPLGPFLSRPTLRTEVAKGVIWTFEQEQALGFGNVITNIRMTVIRLKSGGLWVHAPIAPTKECIQCSELSHAGKFPKLVGFPIGIFLEPPMGASTRKIVSRRIFLKWLDTLGKPLKANNSVGSTILMLLYAFRGMGWALGLFSLSTAAAVTFYSYFLMS